MAWDTAEKWTSLGVLWWLEGGAGVIAPTHRLGLMWFKLPTSVKEESIQTVSSACPGVGQKGKEQWESLKAIVCHTHKNGVHLYWKHPWLPGQVCVFHPMMQGLASVEYSHH